MTFKFSHLSKITHVLSDFMKITWKFYENYLENYLEKQFR